MVVLNRLPLLVDINLKLRPDCKAHVMELFPDLFDGVGTIKDAVVKLDVNETYTSYTTPKKSAPSHGRTT